jgi:shikimate dehydrogenase
MMQLGLIGYPLGHSLSPKIHRAALKAFGLDGDYSLFPIQPDDQQGLKDVFARVRSGEIVGLNVTIPHKQNVIGFMDELTPIAKTIGAVNTIYMKEGRLIGDNTDAHGFLSDLHQFIESQDLGLDKSALVLGAGGSARAVVYALFHDGWKATIAARRVQQAEELTVPYENMSAVDFDFQSLELSNFKLIVNTTPLGMTPNVDRSPWPENMPFPKASVYDLIYNPRETKLVRDARMQGLTATTGLGMLLEQAGVAFEKWTGLTPPREILYSAVAE